MAEDKFKLPRSSYEELVKIIVAYGKQGKSTTIDDIAKLTGMNRTGISSNNAFLVGAEIVVGGRIKAVTSKGVELARALDHGLIDAISTAWRKVVMENEFLSKMVQAIGVRKGMELSHLENHIAYSAGEPKSKTVMTGSRAVVEILKVSGLVRQDGDKIIPSGLELPTLITEPNQGIGKSSQSIIPTVIGVQGATPPVASNTFTFHIELRIQATPSELDGLGHKIRELLNTLNPE